MGLFSFLKRQENTCKQVESNNKNKSTSNNLKIKSQTTYNNNVLDNQSKIIISRFMDGACNNLYSNSMQFKAALRNILNTKLARASYDNTQYIISLKTNILYYLNTFEEVENLIKSWINNGYVPDNEICISKIQMIQKNCRIGNLSNAKNNHLLKLYENLSPINRQIEQLEFDYMYYNAYSEVLYNLVDIILNHRQEFANLYRKESNLVIKEIKGYSHLSISNCLGTLKLG
ncbi:hypothetical protein LPC27_01355 [Paraclostridium bifermentans]|uniref:hypothetical protein n=1 Tax=Paraclostridium bifermentans TaxID=1490 RepID=UPI001F455983|nr:hypothetical protein [Paraclostridium bifermentans]MCE9674398.1 hypothetical protein [Paraclostridium bifermentans]